MQKDAEAPLDVIAAAVRDRVARLRQFAAAPDAFGELATSLADLHEGALAQRSRLDPRSIRFTAGRVAELAGDPRLENLIDQCAPGLGSVDASCIVMGTEAAFHPKEATNFSLEACALGAVWLSGWTPSVVEAIVAKYGWAGADVFASLPELYPRAKRSSHTWGKASWVYGAAFNTHWERVLLHVGELSLWRHAYFIDLSARPARRMVNGSPPSEQRFAFLERLLPTLTARVLWFHGGFRTRAAERFFSCGRELVARAFLRLPPHVRLPVPADVHARPWLFDYQGRRLICTAALSCPITRQYRDAVANLIRPFLRLSPVQLA